MNESSFQCAAAMASCGDSVRHRGVVAYGRALGAAGGLATRVSGGNKGEARFAAALYESPPYDLAVPALPIARLAITLDAARVSGGLQDDAPRDFDTSQYSLFLTPAHASSRWRKGAPSRHLMVYFDPMTVFAGADDAALHGLASPIHNESVAGIRAIARSLERELVEADAFAAEAVDSLAQLMLVKLLRAGTASSAEPLALDSRLLQRLRDFVDANLSARILVADLAEVVGLESGRLARDLKRSTGLSPHRYIVACRLKKAVGLLRRTSMSLVDVALECGFANQQHMTNSMKQNLGVTPGACRSTPGLAQATCRHVD